MIDLSTYLERECAQQLDTVKVVQVGKRIPAIAHRHCAASVYDDVVMLIGVIVRLIGHALCEYLGNKTRKLSDSVGCANNDREITRCEK